MILITFSSFVKIEYVDVNTTLINSWRHNYILNRFSILMNKIILDKIHTKCETKKKNENKIFHHFSNISFKF